MTIINKQIKTINIVFLRDAQKNQHKYIIYVLVGKW